MKNKVKLTDICKIEKGKQIDTTLLSDDKPFKYINGGIKESGYYFEYNTEGNTVTVSEGGASCGYVGFVEDRFWCGCHCYRLLDCKINPKYLYYSLKFNQEIIMDLRTGAAMPNIRKESFKNLELLIDDDTNNEEKIVAELDSIQQEIDFLETKMEAYKSAIQSRFNELFEDITERVHLSEWCDKITDGSHLPPKGVEKSDYLMLSSQNVFDVLTLDGARFLSKEDFDKENKRTDIQIGDVLLTIVGTIGRTHIVQEGEKFVFQRSVAVIKPKKNILDSRFLVAYLKTQDALDQFEISSHGTSQKGLYLSDLKQLEIPLADYETQKQFATFADLIDKLAKTAKERLELLLELLETKMSEHFGD